MDRIAFIAASTFLFLASAAFGDGSSADVGSDSAWKTGVAKVAITPEERVWMAGYAARTRPADGKLTDLWAKALVLEDNGGNRGVVLTCLLYTSDAADE